MTMTLELNSRDTVDTSCRLPVQSQRRIFLKAWFSLVAWIALSWSGILPSLLGLLQDWKGTPMRFVACASYQIQLLFQAAGTAPLVSGTSHHKGVRTRLPVTVLQC
eukprot:m.155822 g.155822  ORF g.155822 m.155822 type:complete len:106 (+) comp16284_c2_seq1:702-1019(+)